MITAVAALVTFAVVLIGGPVVRPVVSELWTAPSPHVRAIPASRAGVWCAGALLVGGLVVSSPLVAGPLAISAALAGRLVEPIRCRRRHHQRRAAVTALVDGLTRAVRSGATLAGAVDEVRRDAVAPSLDDELRRLRAELDAGRLFPVALDEWSRRTDDRDLRLLAGTVAVLAVAGGSTAPALDAAARTIRARMAADAEVRALSSQATASTLVLVLAPLLFAGVLAAVDPRLAAFLLGHPGGAACVSLGLALDGLGLWWMQRIIDGATS